MTGCFIFWVFGFLQTLFYYQKLPGMMGSHFDRSGQIDRWIEKPLFFMIYLGTLFVLLALPEILDSVLRSLSDLRFRSVSEQRKEQILNGIKQRVNYFGIGSGLCLMGIAQLAIETHFDPLWRLSLPFLWTLLSFYFFYLAGWVAVFIFWLKALGGRDDHP